MLSISSVDVLSPASMRIFSKGLDCPFLPSASFPLGLVLMLLLFLDGVLIHSLFMVFSAGLVLRFNIPFLFLATAGIGISFCCLVGFFLVLHFSTIC